MLVRKHEEQSLLHFPIQDDSVKFLSGLVYPRAVVGVNHKNETLGAGEVVPPQRTDLVLTANIPHVEFDILIRHGLDVEAHGRDRSHVLVEFEFVEDG